MTEALLVSNVLLWIAVVLLCGVVFALVRQVGLLHERVAPVGALAIERGPQVGEPAPRLELEALDGSLVSLGGADPSGARTLLFFLSPTCPVCDTLLPTLERLRRGQPDVRVVYASVGEVAEHRDFARAKRLDSSEYVISTELGMRYEVSKHYLDR